MIAVCVKWVAGLPEPGDERFAGISPADQAALELALRQAAVTTDTVTVITVGPVAAERALRDALACGAAEAVRIDAPSELDGAQVAALLAAQLAGASSVWCGDYSPDRGTGSVPAFLAAYLAGRQALGVVEVVAFGEQLQVVRRLDGGRREVLRLRTASAGGDGPTGPAVVSVEGASARLRRAGLAAYMQARDAAVRVVPTERFAERQPPVVAPYRPRARALAAPEGTVVDRLRQLTEADAAPGRGETVHLDPASAAARIVTALRDWGYLP
jgi:electron transfer flavoprotein beta subunit